MNCNNTYYFINDFNQICKQKNGVQKEFSEILELQNLIEDINEIIDKNEQLKSENKRLTDKLNKTALELVDKCISQGKATEISEMSYREFLDYRAENEKPMELHL